jgi:hypothetical protein
MTRTKLESQIVRLETEIAEYRLELRAIPTVNKQSEMLQTMIANANEAIANRVNALATLS